MTKRFGRFESWKLNLRHPYPHFQVLKMTPHCGLIRLCERSDVSMVVERADISKWDDESVCSDRLIERS